MHHYLLWSLLIQLFSLCSLMSYPTTLNMSMSSLNTTVLDETLSGNIDIFFAGKENLTQRKCHQIYYPNYLIIVQSWRKFCFVTKKSPYKHLSDLLSKLLIFKAKRLMLRDKEFTWQKLPDNFWRIRYVRTTKLSLLISFSRHVTITRSFLPSSIW